uniref:Uncharacterized protein n=1 Tax=Anopheles maculatus TaxID=74869 RepID=A0A182SPJ7_9DIPT
MIGRPFSQQDVAGPPPPPAPPPPPPPPPPPLREALFCEVCETAPGLRAPDGAPVAEPPGLSEGAFVAEIGDWELAVVVCPPLTSSCRHETKRKATETTHSSKNRTKPPLQQTRRIDVKA